MADAKISALPAVTVPALTDEIPVNQAGTTKKETISQVLSLGLPNWSTAGATYIYTYMDGLRFWGYASSGFGTYTSKAIYLIIVPCNQSGVIRKLDVYIRVSAGSGAGSVLGVYENGGNLLGSANVVNASGQPLTATLDNPVTMVKGNVYWFAWTTEHATVSLQSIFNGSTEDPKMHNLDSQVRAGIAANPSTGSGASLALPTTFAGLGAISANTSGSTSPYIQGRP